MSDQLHDTILRLRLAGDRRVAWELELLARAEGGDVALAGTDFQTSTTTAATPPQKDTDR